MTNARQSEFEAIRAAVTSWAPECDDIVAVALVGSWARSTASMDSDIDIVVLTTNPDRYIQAEDWLVGALAQPGEITRTAAWGPLTERRVCIGSGLEVEFGFVAPAWGGIDPVDPGTCSVINGGCEPWYDPEGVVASLVSSVTTDA